MIKQLPWIERSFQFDFPVAIYPVIFSRLEGSIFRLHSILYNIDEMISSTSTNGWSAKEHLGHLHDLEELWWNRLNDFATGKEILTAADMTNAKTNAANHNLKTIPELLDRFVKERQRLLEIAYCFDEDMLLRTAIHPRLSMPMRLIDSLYFVAEHDDHHIAVISEILRKA